MCLIYLNCTLLLSCLCQCPPTPSLLSDFIYLFTPFCCCHHVVSFIFISFLVLFSPTWCLSSPLLSFPLSPPPTSPPSSLHLPSITVSQRHSQTGGGVKRWWAPGNPRGAFQWQGPQVNISRAVLFKQTRRQ